VTGDPSNIGHAGELVIRVDIENIFDGDEGPEQIASSAVYDTFGFPG